MRIDTTFCQFITGFQFCTVQNLDSGTVRNQICLGFTGLMISHNDLTFLLCIIDIGCSCKFCDNCKSLWLSCLKKLFDTRKTLCNIITGNTTGMERTHGQLCTRFTDRLSCNDSDSLTNLYRLTGCHVGTITFCTYTIMRSAGQNSTDLNLLKRITVFVHSVIHDHFCTFRSYHMVCFHKNISVFIYNVFAEITSCDTILQAFNYFISVHECFYIHSRNLCTLLHTVHFMNDQFLRYIYQTSGQVSGIGCTKSGI